MNGLKILLPVTTVGKGDVMQMPEAVAAMRRWGRRGGRPQALDTEKLEAVQATLAGGAS